LVGREHPSAQRSDAASGRASRHGRSRPQGPAMIESSGIAGDENSGNRGLEAQS
jgi:hypothetical protein